ncbi:MAG: toxin-antitoxin system protein [Planctomycetota bacterium]
MSATVRITPESHRKLKSLAEDLGTSMPAVLEQAIEALRRQRFLEQASQAYGELRRDKKAWAAEQAERKAWDKTLKDGLDKE